MKKFAAALAAAAPIRPGVIGATKERLGVLRRRALLNECSEVRGMGVASA
jgi:hypothetical protein